MADATPTDVADPVEPADDEGKKPAPGTPAEPAAEEPQGKSYPEAYVKQLRADAKSARQRADALEAKARERDDADKTETEKLTERATTAEQRATEAELKLLRLEVAAEVGLDAAAVQFLTGNTREEIEHRAEELARLLKDKGKPAAGGFDGGARQPAPVKGTPEQEHNQFLLDALGRGRRAS